MLIAQSWKLFLRRKPISLIFIEHFADLGAIRVYAKANIWVELRPRRRLPLWHIVIVDFLWKTLVLLGFLRDQILFDIRSWCAILLCVFLVSALDVAILYKFDMDARFYESLRQLRPENPVCKFQNIQINSAIDFKLISNVPK